MHPTIIYRQDQEHECFLFGFFLSLSLAASYTHGGLDRQSSTTTNNNNNTWSCCLMLAASLSPVGLDLKMYLDGKEGKYKDLALLSQLNSHGKFDPKMDLPPGSVSARKAHHRLFAKATMCVSV